MSAGVSLIFWPGAYIKGDGARPWPAKRNDKSIAETSRYPRWCP